MTMMNTMSLPSNQMRALQGAKGEPGAMGLEAACSRLDCSRQVVTSLEDRDFCFDHFCAYCYELLERSDRSGDLAAGSERFREELLTLDECARRALEISFSRVPLNNLDRARLLDILLWAGELTNTLRHRRTAAPEILSLAGKALTRR